MEEYETLTTNWLKWDNNEKSRLEIEELWKKKDTEALKSRMCEKMSFGTAGVRTKMEAGFGRLNDLTILMLTNGFAIHLKNVYNRESNGVAIGYDGRHNSERWATLAANVFVQNDIKVYLFSKCCPTPLVSYATIQLKCDAGLMITASHNPKQDNGYKAYWTNGAQILAPHDSEICRIAYENMEPKQAYWDISKLPAHLLLHSADRVMEKYFTEEFSLCLHKSLNEKCPLKFTYTAFHGVGLPYMMRLLKEFGFPPENIIVVQEHAEPNPDFPTVPFPNPEEGRQVLTIPIATADKHSSTIILANDPDADRFQLAEKQPKGEWRIFTGNEMGALMSWWVWHCWQERNPQKDPSNLYIVNSAVSSSISRTIAAKEGFNNDVGLTGFKWLGNKTDSLRHQGKTVLLAWEESIGFMLGRSLDKDGITAAAVFAELTSYLYSNGLTLFQQLFKIYSEYGFHLISSSYWFVPNQITMKNIFAKIRKDNKYPQKIGKFNVKYVRDLTTGYDNEQPGNKPILPLSTSSEMITFTLADGSWATIRASGTEPKIKYYIEFKSLPGKTEKDLADAQKQLAELEQAVVDNLLEPKTNGLIERC
uniref:Phosphoglucomutase (alpha-D-glucose-1,6-bisphosphate-dependent) n=1 Tax=Setaria digitata TaxID=48799 RepID=A0A915PP68_9BILA